MSIWPEGYDDIIDELSEEPPKECPFCAGVPLPNFQSDEMFMECSCKAQGPSKHSFKEALEAWNTRAGEKE